MSLNATSQMLKAPPCAGLFVGGGVSMRNRTPDRKRSDAACLPGRPAHFPARNALRSAPVRRLNAPFTILSGAEKKHDAWLSCAANLP